ERSAAYIGLGIAQSVRKPVVIICTSGTAVTNYLPAIVEAHYQEIPLLVLTADRPDEWIDQQDGQAIRQRDVFGSFVKKHFHLPVSYQHPDAVWHVERVVNEAIIATQEMQRGPVHLNIPIREPFYPDAPEQIVFGKPKIIYTFSAQLQLDNDTLQDIQKALIPYKKIAILKGQDLPDSELDTVLRKLKIPVFTDIISNASQLPNTIKYHDAYLGMDFPEKSSLKPDLLISFGKSILSKQLKLFLRNNPQLNHWHIQAYGGVADTFQSLERIIRINPLTFFNKLFNTFKQKENISFFKNWLSVDKKTAKFNSTFFSEAQFGEFEAVKLLLETIPANSVLHLANSMSVRYANFMGLAKDVTVFSNRGTSGIDGCLSTAVGHALTDNRLHFVITGDLAFFYDSNAFWNKYHLPNLRILLLNNKGGAIFRMISGPDKTAAFEDFFITSQQNTAKDIASLHQLKYVEIAERESFLKHIIDFTDPTAQKPCIIEITEKQEHAKKMMINYKQHLNKMLQESSSGF
ncbi:MAG: 2-succinyl-5-enolpyruvyl-6-hydroxy-3-cyclohexene-1-carboxylic-acid synthase, partial [Bacteroidota bacterium]